MILATSCSIITLQYVLCKDKYVATVATKLRNIDLALLIATTAREHVYLFQVAIRTSVLFPALIFSSRILCMQS